MKRHSLPIRAMQVGVLLFAFASRVHAAELATRAWYFQGTGLDFHHALKAGGTKKLKGSSGSEFFVLGFPTNETFVLQHYSYEIARGAVRTRRGAVSLIPDAASVEVLRWWLENQIESHWNAGVFDLQMSLRLSRLTATSISVSSRALSDAQKGLLTINLKFEGRVQRLDQSRIIGRRFGPGPARGSARYTVAVGGAALLEDFDEAYPYPPEVPCTEEEFSEWGSTDYCYEP